jgi:23S rRNA pseudouridine1911/1915/1917 synthase
MGAENYTPAPLVRQVPGELAGLRLDQALARMFPEHSRNRLALWLRDGHIRVDAGSAKPRQKIWGGERIELVPQAGVGETAAQPEAIALAVVHEDADLLVIDKPAGLVVHPGSGNWRGTMLNALLHRCPDLAAIPRAGIVHRLDKDTSGLLVVAKTLQAQTSLVRQLQERSVKREYLAVVYGRLEHDGEIEAPVGRDPASRVRMAVVGSGKDARTRYRVLEKFADITLVECRLDTGRTHQIRVHMQSIGHALVGDPVYRNRRRSRAESRSALKDFGRQALHAAQLEFVHPRTGAPARFGSPLPGDFLRLLELLREESRSLA